MDPSERQKVAARSTQGLSLRQQNFIAEYLSDPTSYGAAATRAGYSNGDQAGYRLMQNPKVRAEMDRRIRKRIEKTDIDAEWVLKELALLASVDLRQVFDEFGNLKPVQEMSESVAKFVTAIEVAPDGTQRIKTADRLKILELIGKHVTVSAFSENLKIQDEDRIVARIMEARRQARAARLGPGDAEPEPTEH
jgi:phage terminase small subunit